MSDTDLRVEVRGGLIIVSLPGTESSGIYTKPGGQPELVLVVGAARQAARHERP